MFSYLIPLILILIPIYPKFPLLGVGGSFVSIRLEDLVLAAVYLVWVIWAIKQRLWKKITPIQKSIILYWMIGLVAVFSGIFLTKTTTLSLGLLHFVRRIEYMGIFFIGYTWLKNRDQLKFFINTIIVVSVIVATYGLGQQFFKFPIISTNNSEFSKGLALTLGPGARINSTFAGHYDLAAYSVFPILIILGLLMIPNRGKPLLAGIGLLCYWAMLLSASRVTFAALLFAASLMAILMQQKKWILTILILGAVGLVSSPQLLGRYRELIVNNLKISYVTPTYASTEDIPDALKPPVKPEDRSLNIRLQASWPRALRSLEKNPILGTGFASVGLAVDNDYLRAAAETGILGLTAFGLVFWRFFKATSKIVLHPQSKFEHVFVVAISCSIIALLMNAVFIDIFEASKIAIISWLVMGLAVKTVEIS